MAEQTGMRQEVKVPELGESILEATISRWLKKEGDPVAAGEALVELETEKVNLEVSAPRAGKLERILRKEGEDVKVGEVLAEIGEPGGEGSKAPESGGEVKEEQKEAPRAEKAQAEAQTAPDKDGSPDKDGRRESGRPAEEVQEGGTPLKVEGVKAMVTPVAERLIREQRLDVRQITGSGPGGRITREDVESYLEKAKPEEPAKSQEISTAQPAASPTPPQEAKLAATIAPAPQTAPPPAQAPAAGDRREERVKMSRRRRTIARRLVEAQQTAAMLSTFNEVDMSAVMELRARRNAAFTERHGIKLGITSFFVKASVGALKAFPQVNAEIQGEEMVLKHYYDIGVAVGAREGLVVPVLRDADRLSFAEIERRIKDFAQRAENDTLTLEDLRGGTFTITNGGVFGSLLSTPILNPPQVGILGLHKIEKRPVIVGEEIVARQMMYVALSYDHRIVDGREAVQFLVRVKELIEDPETLLLEG